MSLLLLFVLLSPVHCRYETGTTAPSVTLTQYTTWFNQQIMGRNIKQGPPDDSGSFLLVSPSKLQPYCDDYWTDFEANKLCRLWNFKQGRRASQIVRKERMFSTVPVCYDTWDLVRGGEIFSIEDCRDGWTIPETHGCADDQAAAVFCWDTDWLDEFSYISHTTSKKKWSLSLNFFNVKYGERYNAVGPDSLIGKPKNKDFVVMGCGKTAKVNMSQEKKKKVVKLKGKWIKRCDKCFEFYYQGNQILPEVCVSPRLVQTKGKNEGE